mgnify:CR=1 FL=1
MIYQVSKWYNSKRSRHKFDYLIVLSYSYDIKRLIWTFKLGVIFFILDWGVIMDQTPMTPRGEDLLRKELQRLKTVERPRIVAAIAEARSHGDLSENAEYDAAKEAQAKLETKIAELKAQIHSAKIIDTARIRTDVVQILSTVEMRNVKSGTKMKYTIVSESEADLRSGQISSETPIAQALIGHKVGDIVDAKTPRGIIQFEVLNIRVE